MAEWSDRESLAWIAGFFSGEGCTTLSVVHNNYGVYEQPRLFIGNTNLEVLTKAQSIIGGTIRANKLYKGRKQPYQLYINGFEGVQAVIAAMWPWLSSEKKEQAEEILLDHRTYARMLKRPYLYSRNKGRNKQNFLHVFKER
jgi:hypothetical protein